MAGIRTGSDEVTAQRYQYLGFFFSAVGQEGQMVKGISSNLGNHSRFLRVMNKGNGLDL